MFVAGVSGVLNLYSNLRCNTLQHTRTRCNTIRHNTLQLTSNTRGLVTIFAAGIWNAPTTQTLYKSLQHTATHCNTLQLTATHCNTQEPVTIFVAGVCGILHPYSSPRLSWDMWVIVLLVSICCVAVGCSELQ